jgi:hypothetical protein
MKMQFETIVGLCLILSVLFSGCIQPGCIQGSGNYTTENRTVDDFSSMSFSSAGEVYLSQGPKHLRIEAEDNIIRGLMTEVGSGRLTIRHTAACINPQKPIKIYVSTPHIEGLDISGSGSITGLSPIESDALRIDISGSGDINLDVDCKDLSTTISGSGSAVLKGRATDNSVDISGSGAVHSYDLETNRSTVRISGSGTAEVRVHDELNTNISGSGSVSYKGHPVMTRQEISGSGSVINEF